MGLLSILRYYVTQIVMYVLAGLDSFKNSSNDGTTEKEKLSSSSSRKGEIQASLFTHIFVRKTPNRARNFWPFSRLSLSSVCIAPNLCVHIFF